MQSEIKKVLYFCNHPLRAQTIANPKFDRDVDMALPLEKRPLPASYVNKNICMIIA